MALYEVRGTVTVTGTVFIEHDGDLTEEQAANVLKDQLVGNGAKGLQYAETDSTEVDVETFGETDDVYTTIR